MTKDSRNPSTNANLAAALGYAARGWHVFPLRPGSKKPATPTHPANRCDGTDLRCTGGHAGWEQRATTCPDRITRAWTRTPEFGVGIACGPSRLVVLDLDTPKPGAILPPAWADEPGVHDGADVLAVLADRAHQPWPTTWAVTTPTGGAHLYFTVSEHGPQLSCTAGRLGPLVDTRAGGGYVVAPPTTTIDGGYAVVVDDDPVRLPQWLATKLAPPPRPPHSATPRACGTSLPRYVAVALTHEVGCVVHAAPGTRNQALFVSALALGQLVGAGVLTAEQVTTALHDAATAHVAAGAFTAAEAVATIASGLRRGIADPRTLPRNRPSDGRGRPGTRDRQECA